MKNKSEKITELKSENESKSDHNVFLFKQEPKKTDFFLVVKMPFRNYKKGDIISNDEEINHVLNCHEEAMVNKFNPRV